MKYDINLPMRKICVYNTYDRSQKCNLGTNIDFTLWREQTIETHSSPNNKLKFLYCYMWKIYQRQR